MSDTSYPAYQHYGTAAQRAAFTPNPPATGQPIYLWYETDTGDTYLYDTSWHAIITGGGAGDVVGPGSSTDEAVARFDGTTGKLLQNSVVTISDAGAITLPDDIRQTFNPGANNAGLNVGSLAGDPATPSNGDIWYDSTANELTARINGATVALGAGGINQLTGDITAGPGTGSQAATIANDAVTFAKMQDIASDRLLGRDTAGSGDVEEIIVGAGIEFSGSGGIRTTVANRTRSVAFVIDGGGSAITTGVKGDFRFPVAGTIVKNTLLADQSGSIVLDIWKDTFANYPPTVADTITAAAKPTLSAAAASEDGTLTGWTTSIAAGDCFRINVDSASTLTRVTLVLDIQVTG